MAQNTKFVEGNVGKIYELRTVGAKNSSVLDFSVASTPRKRNADGEWEDGDTVWTNITAWGKLAENISATWKPGDQVFVRGREEMKPGYTNRDDEEMPARVILIADLAGHDNSRFASTQDRESGRSAGGNAGGSSRPAASQKPAAKSAPRKPPVTDDAELFNSSDDELDTELPF